MNNKKQESCWACGEVTTVVRMDHCFKIPSGLVIYVDIPTIVCSNNDCREMAFGPEARII